MNPELKAGTVSRCTYSWISPLLFEGAKRPLTTQHLYPLSPANRAEEIYNVFEDAWEAIKKIDGKARVQSSPIVLILRASVISFGSGFAKAAVFLLFQNLVIVAGPLLLLYLLRWIENYQSEVQPDLHVSLVFPYMLAVGLFCIQILTTFLTNWNYEMSQLTGFRLRTALTMALYKKSLRLSTAARNMYSTGFILNCSVSDTNRIDLACQFFHGLWGSPLLILITTGLLFWILGPSCLVGLALMVAYAPLQNYWNLLLTKYRRSANFFTDERVRTIQEAVSGIRILKIYSWEASFKSIINEIRTKELHFILRYLVVRASISAVTQVIPTFAMIATFACYALLGNPLSASIILSSLSLFYTLRIPLLILPQAINQALDALVAFERISNLLLASEINDNLPILDGSNENAIEIFNATFSWGTEIKTIGNQQVKPGVLIDINLVLPKGKLVAIIGPVGSGKSSLFSAIIGEMERLKGEVIVRGTLSYCQQSAWIQNATIRDNILFGLPFESEKYEKTIHLSALASDLNQFLDGDRTEIGERGINLSGYISMIF